MQSPSSHRVDILSGEGENKDIKGQEEVTRAKKKNEAG